MRKNPCPIVKSAAQHWQNYCPISRAMQLKLSSVHMAMNFNLKEELS